MPEMTPVQNEKLNILRATAEGRLSEYLKQNKTDLAHDIARELHEAGMIKAVPFKPTDGRASYPSAKITSRGRDLLEELEKLAVPDRAPDPSANQADHEHDSGLVDTQDTISPYRIAEGVIVVILGAAALWAMGYHFGLLK